MLKIGLTGGIGSGKSTISQLFSELDVPVIDTDVLAHELVRPGQSLLAKIEQAFGPEIITKSGSLDREALRQRVFADQKKRLELEAILHPAIAKRIDSELAQLTAPYCIIVIPLLFEKGWQDKVDRILAVDAAEPIRIQRTRARDGLSESDILQIMATQVKRDILIQRADDIIVNDSDKQALMAKVQILHKKYLKLAKISA